ncbi:HU family DNA-binding protein [Candidatus Acetothermia bacterium]|jgi:DNA-binding protein HU-beta|nr:HU family DNA-binding protein [Candidatus Acetothermia bacterium]MBI3643856.1 HU family DNA-binding protein [Candidatus Acetothermia bacterium]
MNKKELVNQLANKTHLSKQKTTEALDAFLDIIVDSCGKNQKVKLPGFGSFEAYKRKSVKRVNPRTKQPVEVPSRWVPKFRPSTAFKKTLNT